MIANEAMHRMSGAHICSRFEWSWMPLIGDLDRWASSRAGLASAGALLFCAWCWGLAVGV